MKKMALLFFAVVNLHSAAKAQSNQPPIDSINQPGATFRQVSAFMEQHFYEQHTAVQPSLSEVSDEDKKLDSLIQKEGVPFFEDAKGRQYFGLRCLYSRRTASSPWEQTFYNGLIASIELGFTIKDFCFHRALVTASSWGEETPVGYVIYKKHHLQESYTKMLYRNIPGYVHRSGNDFTGISVPIGDGALIKVRMNPNKPHEVCVLVKHGEAEKETYYKLLYSKNAGDSWQEVPLSAAQQVKLKKAHYPLAK